MIGKKKIVVHADCTGYSPRFGTLFPGLFGVLAVGALLARFRSMLVRVLALVTPPTRALAARARPAHFATAAGYQAAYVELQDSSVVLDNEAAA